jgi:hypothetical protein
MPIDIDKTKRGKTIDSMAEMVKKFLQSNPDKAYLATELFEVMKGRKLQSQADLFEIQNVISNLMKDRSIIVRHVETKDGFQAYYSISEG